MRLIDADEIKLDPDLPFKASVRRVLAQAPTVDAVPVIRCRDCKRWLKDVAGCTDYVGRCEYANYMVSASGYCVYGERRGAGNG